jgi:ADP-heptose:LPS heptosyltransferase
MIARLAMGALHATASSLRRKQIPREEVRSVAIVELTGLGDAMAMLPTIREFQSLFPAADLHVIVDELLVELLLSFDQSIAVHGIRNPAAKQGVWTAVKILRRLRPSLACSMSPPRRNALVVLASGAKCIAGYLRYTDSLTPFLLETPVEVFGLPGVGGFRYGRDNLYDRGFAVCRTLGGDGVFPAGKLEIASLPAERARENLSSAGLLPRGEYVVIHPFAGWRFREWPLGSYAALARQLTDSGNVQVAFLWEESKQGHLESLRHELKDHASVTFASNLTLLESAVLIEGASLFVGNDSGPLHLAAALGVPSVGLFGPAPPSLTAPGNLTSGKWLYHPVDCSPCDQRRCVRTSHSCMTMIEVEEAVAAAMTVQGRSENV